MEFYLTHKYPKMIWYQLCETLIDELFGRNDPDFFKTKPNQKMPFQNKYLPPYIQKSLVIDYASQVWSS